MDNKIDRNITIEAPLYLKYFRINIVIKPFEVEEYKTTYKIKPSSTTMYMQILNKSSQNGMPDSYPVNITTFYDVREKFNIVASWFDDEGKKALYSTLDNGNLVFNTEYNNLAINYTTDTANRRCVIRIKPTVIEVGINKSVPGVIIYLNKLENYIILNESEFRKIVNFLNSFSFIDYETFAITCVDYSIKNNTLMTQHEIAARYNYHRQVNGTL